MDETSPSAAADTSGLDTVGPAQGTDAASSYRWYVLGILTIVYTFNFIDRQIIAILSPAIKEELGLSDTVLGLLKGLAFAALYSILGIPLAWLADRWNRVSLISISLALWSGFTALSGLAGSVTQLTLARIGVGIGEAGCSPPAHSLISDYFAKEERAQALSIYSLGIPFGQMFAFLAGGWMVQELGWRSAFFLVGIPGLLLALIMKFTVKEPIRGSSDNYAAASPATREEFMAGLREMLTIPSYWGVTIAVTLISFTGYGMILWIVDFYRRVHELSYLEITLPLALLNGVAYGIGTFMGGWLTVRAAKKNIAAYVTIPGIAALATIPFGLASLWAPTPFLSFAFSAPFLIFIGIYLGPSFSLIQTLAPLRLRSVATAIFFLVLNLIALGFAAPFVGALSDFFLEQHGEANALRIGMSALSIFSLAAAGVYYWTSKRLPEDWKAAEERNSGGSAPTI
ncbi:MAG: MFS transporter [Pseudomonadota bacterium]